MAAFVQQGLNTGLIGYTLRNEFLGETIYYRQNQIFDYEIYSVDNVTLSPNTIQQNLLSAFSIYSGNIQVKVFEAPVTYQFPNDGIRAAKFHARVEVKTYDPSITTVQTELNNTYYTGLGNSFWSGFGPQLIDFKEEFAFAKQEDGTNSYNHSLSFSLLTGTKAEAVSLASGLFVNDPYTTFGIIANSGGAYIANSNNYIDYYQESYDLIRQSYRFNKRRDVFPTTGYSGFYNFNHTMEMKENGIVEVSEHGAVQAALSFNQVYATTEALVGGSYSRLNPFYLTYSPLASPTNTAGYGLVVEPMKIVKNYNQQKFTSEYDVTYTNDPEYAVNGARSVSTIEFDVDPMGTTTIKHNFDFMGNRRLSNLDFFSLISSATGSSPGLVSNYYASQGYDYNSSLPINLIRSNATWPNRDNKASVSMEYSSHPKFFRTVNGITFNYLDSTIENMVPSDIMQEYKIINRPSKTSVLNYAYQTDKGQIVVKLEGGIGRNPNEFTTGFRNGFGGYLTALYKYGIGLFAQQFMTNIPTAFTYYLSDIKYSLNQDGILTMTLTFTYTMKKYEL